MVPDPQAAVQQSVSGVHPDPARYPGESSTAEREELPLLGEAAAEIERYLE
jgi:hypothetical protein